MNNTKIFVILLFIIGILYVGLEKVPKLYENPLTEISSSLADNKASDPLSGQESLKKEKAKQDRIGFYFMAYFSIMSLLLYIKILLQRRQSPEV